MAGHSKWKNIQHRKGAQDAKRGKIFTKLIKEISVAVKTGGGPDLDANPRLRLAVQNAKGMNMPKDNVEKAIKKASGQGGENFLEITYEGYGPDGVAVYVESATDNNTRTVASIRSYFKKCGGALGKDGCLEFIFDRKGIFILKNENINEDDFTLDLIDVGAEDVEFQDEEVIVTTLMEDFASVRDKIEALGLETLEAGLVRIPSSHKEITGKSLTTFFKLIDLIEDDDDVQKVYHNAEFDEAELENL